MVITDAQKRYIENNCPAGLISKSLDKISKEDACSIISDMVSGGFVRNTMALGYIEFWNNIKKRIDKKYIVGKAGWNSRANSRNKLPSNPLSQL